MQMIRFLSKRYPKVNIALHAGELTLGLVPPDDLRFHITEAVDIAGAQRIGHRVDLFYEREPFALLQRMHDSRTTVEICLTSNDVILGVKGSDHPFRGYLEWEVPVVLASDDAGVSRIDLSHEYLRAVRDYGLTYDDLKELSRNSLEYSFLEGGSLWQTQTTTPFTRVADCADDEPGDASPSALCRQLLKRSARASEQWRLERAFAEFERLDWLRE